MVERYVTYEMWERLVARVGAMEGDLKVIAEKLEGVDTRDVTMAERQAQMHKALLDIQTTLSKMSGGARVVMWLGGAVGALGAWSAGGEWLGKVLGLKQ